MVNGSSFSYVNVLQCALLYASNALPHQHMFVDVRFNFYTPTGKSLRYRQHVCVRGGGNGKWEKNMFAKHCAMFLK